ncbi:MAG TPA: hypothetical protein VF152_03410 [Acidimicrobiia bacterium]
MRDNLRVWASATVAGVLLLAVLHACGGDDTGTALPSSSPPQDFVPEADDFANIHTMTKVRGFYVDNRLGHLDEALAVANSPDGGTYPVGTIIQLVPQEAMVKRRAGFSPATRDWEFFFLDVSPEGTVIEVRGTDEVVNRFGGNCASCHSAAEPQFDMVCEDDHGCDPLPIGDDVILAVQEADPRPLEPAP